MISWFCVDPERRQVVPVFWFPPLFLLIIGGQLVEDKSFVHIWQARMVLFMYSSCTKKSSSPDFILFLIAFLQYCYTWWCCSCIVHLNMTISVDILHALACRPYYDAT
jgi:hypothetical protein